MGTVKIANSSLNKKKRGKKGIVGNGWKDRYFSMGSQSDVVNLLRVLPSHSLLVFSLSSSVLDPLSAHSFTSTIPNDVRSPRGLLFYDDCDRKKKFLPLVFTYEPHTDRRRGKEGEKKVFPELKIDVDSIRRSNVELGRQKASSLSTHVQYQNDCLEQYHLLNV